MGYPLAPVFANIFMGFHESKWLNEHNLNKSKLYLRYDDDILAAIDNEQDSLNFLNFLNNRYSNIKFTLEKQINHSVAFLDVFISGISNQNLTLQTYHKLTYKGILLNFKSFTSFSYKISLIKCLIGRLKFVIIGNPSIMTEKTLIPVLLNMHIDRVIKKYLDYKFSSKQTQLKDKSVVHYFKLPYTGTFLTFKLPFIGNLSIYLSIYLSIRI